MTEVRRLRVRYGDEVSDLEVLLPAKATVEVLADVLGAADGALSITGRRLLEWHSLDQAGVFDGVELEVDREPTVDDAATPVVVVDQLAGLPGGDSRLLAPGTFAFMSTRTESVAFSLEVSSTGAITVHPGDAPVVIDNVRITSPTSLTDRILNAGSSRYTIGQLPPNGVPADPPSTRQRTRVAAGSLVRSVTPPALPRLEPTAIPKSWLGLVPVAIVFAVLGLTVDASFFAAAAAMIAASIALLISRRVARQNEVKEHRELTRKVVARFEDDVIEARRSVERVLRQANPSIPELARAARGEVAGYWNRSRGDFDFGHVVVGYGESAWRVNVDSEFELPAVLRRIVEDNTLLTSVPIIADLTDGPVGVVGPREAAIACARAIAVTLATQSPASDLKISLAADESQLGDWDWLKWLPQLHPSHPVALAPDEADRMVSSWRTPGHDWLQCVIVDQPKWTLERNSLLSVVAKEPGKQTLLVIAETPEDLPPCATTVEIGEDGLATVRTGVEERSFVSPAAAAEVPTDTISRGAAWLHRDFGEDPTGITATGVRPFQLEPRRFEDPMEQLLPSLADDPRAHDTISIADPDAPGDTSDPLDAEPDPDRPTRWSQLRRDLL